MKLKYDNYTGSFIGRPNRFIAHVEIGGREVISHVPNTGRLKELLVPNATVMVSHHPSDNRKTEYELRMVKKGNNWVSIDSQLPNILAKEAILNGVIKELKGYTKINREVTYQHSRFDLQLSMEPSHPNSNLSPGAASMDFNSLEEPSHNSICFVEVKGVTLEREGWSYFPDASTERGRKHIDELILAVKEGYRAALLFIVQLEHVNGFSPNKVADPAFAIKVKEAINAGVEVLAYCCTVTTDEVKVTKRISVALQ